MRITSDGKVGIGTSSPDSILDLTSTPNNNFIHFNATTGGTNGDIIGGFEVNNTGGTIGKLTVHRETTNSSGYMAFQTGTTEKMRITNAGNVGIGETSPGTLLDIKGVAGANNRITFNTTDAGINGDVLGGFVAENQTDSVGQITVRRESAADDGYIVFETQATGGGLAERMRIDSSGNVGIGETSPLGKLHVKKSDTGASASTSADVLVVEDNSENGISILSGTGTFGNIFFGDSGSNTIGRLLYNHADNSMRFVTNNSEAMRIDSNGRLLIGTTTYDDNNAGILLNGETGKGFFTVSADPALAVHRLTNDGTLVQFQQAGSLEGTISVSGSTVSYNGFTGTHWSRFTDNSTPTILRGTVLETLDEMCDWYNLEFDITTTTQDEDGNDVTNTSTKKIPHVLTGTQSNGDVITYNHEGTDYEATIVKEGDVKHMMSKVSDTTDAKNVYGLFVAYDLDGDGYNDFYVASVGSYVVRIKSGETIAKGDLLQSNGDGTAKVQTDDNIKSSSFAKVLSTTIIETYEDGSYLVPCSLMC